MEFEDVRIKELEERLHNARSLLIQCELSIRATLMYMEQKQKIRAEAWQDAVYNNLIHIHIKLMKEL